MPVVKPTPPPLLLFPSSLVCEWNKYNSKHGITIVKPNQRHFSCVRYFEQMSKKFATLPLFYLIFVCLNTFSLVFGPEHLLNRFLDNRIAAISPSVRRLPLWRRFERERSRLAIKVRGHRVLNSVTSSSTRRQMRTSETLRTLRTIPTTTTTILRPTNKRESTKDMPTEGSTIKSFTTRGTITSAISAQVQTEIWSTYQKKTTTKHVEPLINYEINAPLSTTTLLEILDDMF